VGNFFLPETTPENLLAPYCIAPNSELYFLSYNAITWGCHGFDQECGGRGCEPGVSSDPAKSDGNMISAKTFALPSVGGRQAAALAA